MRKPGFVRLAQIDDTRFITACRHGLVHLTWTRSTVRFAQGEFRTLADLLAQVAGEEPPASLLHGDLQVHSDREGNCSLEIGNLALFLSQAELTSLAEAVQTAVDSLDRVLDSGVWDQDETEAPAGFQHPFRRFLFSEN